KAKGGNNDRTLLRRFRDDTKTLVSMAGVVYEVEKELGIDATQHSYSLMFRDELFDELDADERPTFQHVVGIPIVLDRRKVGLFLLLGSRDHTFDLRDRVYSAVGDLLAASIRSGILLGFFKKKGLTDVFTSAPKLRDEAELLTPISILNTVR